MTLYLLSLFFVFQTTNPPTIENDYVRVLDVTSVPHTKNKLHRHDVDRVMIYLDNGREQFVTKDGHATDARWTAKQAVWSPAGQEHTSENVGDAPFRIIEIELKEQKLPPKPFAVSDTDPVDLDPKHYKLDFENEKVRVFRGKYGPNEEGVMHEHLHNRVVVYLNQGQMKVTTPDGKAQIERVNAGDVHWGEPVKHKDDNVGGPLQLVVVELKNP